MASVPYIYIVSSEDIHISFNFILNNIGGTSQIVYNEDTDDLTVPFLSLPWKSYRNTNNISFISESWPFNDGTKQFTLTSNVIDIFKIFSISKIMNNDDNSTTPSGDNDSSSETKITIFHYVIIGLISAIALIILIVVIILIRKVIYKGKLNHFISEESTMSLI